MSPKQLDPSGLQLDPSGVVVDPTCQFALNDLKERKSKYALFKSTEDCGKVVVDKKGPSSATYADFMNELPKDDCRWAVVTMNFESSTKDHHETETLFVQWEPDQAEPRSRAICSAFNSSVKGALTGIDHEIKASSIGGVKREAVIQTLHL